MIADQQNRIVEELETLARAFTERGDGALADKAAGLADKGRANEMVIAFCGHFSAGKSSLINALCGARLLPSSPIPTSANIVSIKSAETSEAILIYRDGREAHVPLEDVSHHAKDGDTVRSVALRHPIPLLGDHGVLLDTPGVDSTDDHHRESTEAALHLADVVLYVMDYNHVLSEMNMNFAKRLSEIGKPLVLIVNQIDKHREEEVSFSAFREGVSGAFRSWGVEPSACVYTSLKVPDHPWNESERLRALLGLLVANGRELALSGLASAALELVEEGSRALRARHEERRVELERQAATEDTGAAARYEAIAEMLEARDHVRERLEDRIRTETGSIAENANITPATTRDAAQLFLESRQPGFRVGLLFATAKTEEERKRRLETFYREFAEHVKAQLVWHVRDVVKKTGLALGLPDPIAEEIADGIDAEVTPEWLIAKVRAGAVVSGEYTLNYAKELAGDVKQAVKRSAVNAAHRLADAAEAVYSAERASLTAEAAALEAKLSHRRSLEALDTAEREASARLTELLPTAQALARDCVAFPDVAALEIASGPSRQGAAATGSASAPLQPLQNALNLSLSGGTGAERTGSALGMKETGNLRVRFASAADTLEEAGHLAATLPPLAAAGAALMAKARGLREQRFTVALFGAFSAGKSSFANALLGDAALPVSPNPTTAAINTVVPPTGDWPHGVARIVMKTREAMLLSLRHSLQALGSPLPDREWKADDLLHRVEATLRSSADVPPLGKPHLAFLQAVLSGWAEAEPLLGTDVRADRELFRTYVAEERRSAFVERIELFYDSPLSSQGVTLVDTPGADSINARHTGVAFNYMKNADAIFFVTYYNHAFSRADRQFLEQLGRVKDTFELDKMFFIVNAADLASSAEELQDVLEHVRTNLAAFGIRHPRLFPVSSMRALEAKRAGDGEAAKMAGIAAFEKHFAEFAGRELSGLAYRSAEAELRRTVHLGNTLLQDARKGHSEREEALRALEEAYGKANAFIQSIDLEPVRKDVLKEANEQLYYVKQRFMFRFGEWYAASFNPSALREDRGDIKQSLLWAWRDLTGYIMTELVNEALAASLRIERFMNRSVAGAVERWNDAIRHRMERYEPETWEELGFETPEIESVWLGEDPDVKLLSSHYKNAKAFFEGDGRKKLREALERRWQQPIAESVDQLASHFAAWIDGELLRAREAALQRLQGTLLQSRQSARAAWEQPLDAQEIERKLERLQAQLTAFEASSRIWK